MINYFIYIILGILPSIIWLAFYLRKDTHPEPKKKVLEIFFGGILSALLAAIIETLILKQISAVRISPIIYRSLLIFSGIAIIEELLKYIVIKIGVFRDPEFDEPVDIIIYMIISALGFAALENTLLFFSEKMQVLDAFIISGFRLIGATFLHTLCSGIFGFFIACSFLKKENRRSLFAAGFFIVVLLHGIYNFSIMELGEHWRFITPLIVLFCLAIFLSYCFRKLKKFKSICET